MRPVEDSERKRRPRMGVGPDANQIMTPEQHKRARDLFEDALEREPAELVGWLALAEPHDAEVRAEVQSLLDHHSRAGSFLTQPVLESVPDLLDDRALEPGTVLGTYTIVREVGR